MKINPAQFAFYLKSSSLNSDEQQVVLNLLPKLSDDEIEELFNRLKNDHEEMKLVVQRVYTQRESIQFEFYKDLQTPAE